MEGKALTRVCGYAWVLVLLLAVSGPSRLHAQQYFGAITGNVTDPSGGGIPQVAMTVTNTATGVTRQGNTNQFGEYTIGSLTPGTYSVKAQHSGFQTTEVPEVTVQVAVTATIPIVMQLGTTLQTVEVTAVAPQLDAASATVGTVVNNASVVQLPLNGRSYTQLLLLVPGTVTPGTAWAPTMTIGSGQTFSISGNRNEQNNYSLDGTYNNEPFWKSYAIEPSIDAIQEFKVQTNVMSAEFGQAAGANVTVATKSGTNQLHGVFYDFLRNDALDANDFFRNANGIPNPPYKRNQYGVTGGGPIYIPKLYNGRDKAFWFANYEGFKIRRASTNISTIPTTAELTGDLTDQPPIYDPATTRPDPNNPGMFLRDQFSCNGVLNVICPNRIDPTITAYSGIWYPKTDIAGANNLVNVEPRATDEYQFNSRVDYKFKENLQFFGRYTRSEGNQNTPTQLPNNLDILPNGLTNTSVNLTWIANPTTVVDLKSGFARNAIYERNAVVTSPTVAAFLSDHPIAGMPPTSGGYPFYPEVTIPGYAIPHQDSFRLPSNIWQEQASVSIVRGKHSTKMGFEMLRTQHTNDANNQPWFIFSSVPTDDPQNPGATGSGLASYLIGLPTEGRRAVGNTTGYMRSTTYSGYLQDDIKLFPKLTVNMGLRYEYDQWPSEKYNHMSEFDRSSNQFIWAARNPITGQGPNTRPQIVDPDYNNFAPRIGIAYQVDPKTTIRSGFGVFYGGNFLWEDQGVHGVWPFAISEDFTDTNATNPDRPLETYFPNELVPGPTTQPSMQHILARRSRTDYVMQWNLGVQRQLAKDLLLEVNYVGNGGRKLPMFYEVNTAYPGPGDIGSPQHPRKLQAVAPSLGAVLEVGDRATSAYNALQVKLEKRFSHGLQVLTSYSWGRYIDIGGSGFAATINAENPDNIPADRASGNFDIRHVFTTSWVYDLPFGKGRRFLVGSGGLANGLLGGWEMSTIVHCNTGPPLDIQIPFDNPNIGQLTLTQRPNYVGGQIRLTPPAGSDKSQGYINLNALQIPPPYTFGNLGRDASRNLGLINWDAGIFKEFPIREGKERIQFRAEFFNFLNHTNLGYIDSTIGDPAFGAISSTQNPSREIQFALKFYY